MENKKYYVKINQKQQINAGASDIWYVLAERFVDIAEFSKDLKESKCISKVRQDVGTIRYCKMRPVGWVKEEITDWKINEYISFQIIGSSMPIKPGSHLSFQLSPNKLGTEILVRGSFELKMMRFLSFLMTPMMKKMIKTYICDIENAVINRQDARVHDHIEG